MRVFEIINTEFLIFMILVLILLGFYEIRSCKGNKMKIDRAICKISLVIYLVTTICLFVFKSIT